VGSIISDVAVASGDVAVGLGVDVGTGVAVGSSPQATTTTKAVAAIIAIVILLARCVYRNFISDPLRKLAEE
jgi:hypothetical protein